MLAGLVAAACVVVAIGTYTVLRLLDLPVPASRNRPRLNVGASSRGFLFVTGTAMTVWILAWLALLVGGLAFLWGM